MGSILQPRPLKEGFLEQGRFSPDPWAAKKCGWR